MTADVNVVIDHSEYTILVVDDVVSNVLLLKAVSYTHLRAHET